MECVARGRWGAWIVGWAFRRSVTSMGNKLSAQFSASRRAKVHHSCKVFTADPRIQVVIQFSETVARRTYRTDLMQSKLIVPTERLAMSLADRKSVTTNPHYFLCSISINDTC